ncbi:MAG: protein kinase [Thermosynechococcaceae cyanobacterium MS004]|nr:protein kinase [Thermosynechococcaceae cyanobacterium MS004]
MLTAGDLLQYGKYQIDDVLSVKGGSITYRATQCDRAQRVVIKTVAAEYRTADLGIARFLAEARRLAQVHHAHLVRVFDCFVENGRLFLVTEFLAGQTLAQRMTQGLIPLADGLRYIHQVGQAIASLHQQGLLHRDIKPSNIMLVDNGPVDNRLSDGIADGLSADRHGAVLMDVNIARSLVLPNAATQQAPHPSRQHQGTEFLAPETLLSSHLWTAASDVYGLAATLYALVTGSAPAVAPNHPPMAPPATVSQKQRQVAALSEMPQLAQAISSGLAFDLSDRSASMPTWLALLPAPASPAHSSGYIKNNKQAPSPIALRTIDEATLSSVGSAPAPFDTAFVEEIPLELRQVDPPVFTSPVDSDRPAPVSSTPVSSGSMDLEVVNPGLSNPDLSNPDLFNPDSTSPNPTLAVLEHPRPTSSSSTAQRKSRQAIVPQKPALKGTASKPAASKPAASKPRSHRKSLPITQPEKFPHKALLLSAISAGIGGIGFGFFLRVQVFSMTNLSGTPFNLAPKTLPGSSPGNMQETIQEAFPPTTGSQGYSVPEDRQTPGSINPIDPSTTDPSAIDPAGNALNDPEPLPASPSYDAAPPSYSPDAAHAAPAYTGDANSAPQRTISQPDGALGKDSVFRSEPNPFIDNSAPLSEPQPSSLTNGVKRSDARSGSYSNSPQPSEPSTEAETSVREAETEALPR